MHDVDAAQRSGVGVHHCTYALETPSEKVMNENFTFTEAYTALMAGASRLSRLKNGDLKEDEKTMWDTGASVTGPFVYLYAQWILEQAEKKGINELCFLARDAYLPYKATEILLQQKPELDIQLRYIYGSRFTYNALDIQKIGEDEWERLITVSGYRYSALRDLQAALYCKKEAFLKHLKKLGFDESEWNRPLNDDEIRRVRHLALKNEEFNKDILNGVKEFQKLTKEYLTQNKSSERKIALVDAGWTTNSHYPLYNFLKKLGFKDLRLFYIGLTARETKITVEAVDAFIFDVSRNLGLKRKGVFYNRAIESLLLTKHGRTRSFEKRNGSVLPVLDPVENEQFVRSYFDVYEQGVLAFIKEMAPNLKKSSPFHDHRFVAEALIRRFWKHPTDMEARVWSQLDWESDPLGNTTHPLASPYQFSDAWKAFKSGMPPEKYYQFWSGGAEKITPKWEIFAMRRAINARNVAGRIIKKMPEPVKNRIFRFGNNLIDTN